MKRNKFSRGAAFTLLELLVVMLILGLMTALVLPSAVGLVGSSQFNQGMNFVVGQLKYARQLAMSENNTVEVRFYRYADPNGVTGNSGIRAMQLWRGNPGGMRTPVDRLYRFPGSLVISADSRVTRLGEALNSASLTASEIIGTLPSGYQFYAFQFRPDGTTSLTSGSNYFTLITETDPARHAGQGLPANFAAVQIETFTGTVRVFRP